MPCDCNCCKGACCCGTSCTQKTCSECADEGGVFLGNGTQCDEVECDPPTGACCQGYSCSVTSQCECEAAGGIYKGDGTACEPNPCPCTYDGDCPEGYVCVDGECVPASCETTGDCPEGYYCCIDTCIPYGEECPGCECPPCECCDNGPCGPSSIGTLEVSSIAWSTWTLDDPNVPVCQRECELDSVVEDFYATVTCTLVETVECGGTQTTSISPPLPTLGYYQKRFIYSVTAEWKEVDAVSDCASSTDMSITYYGYIDVDVCAPSGGTLTLVSPGAYSVYPCDDWQGGTTPDPSITVTFAP